MLSLDQLYFAAEAFIVYAFVYKWQFGRNFDSLHACRECVAVETIPK